MNLLCYCALSIGHAVIGFPCLMELQLIHSDKDQFSEATGYLMTAGLQQAD